MLATLAHHPPQRKQSFRQSLQRDAAIREYRTVLPSPVLHAQYGRKTECRDLSMLAANVGRASNKAAETTIKLCYGAIDLGVPLATVLHVPETLASLIRARAAEPRLQRSGTILHRIETAIEGRMNDLQVAYLSGDATTQDKVALRREIKEMQQTLAEMDADLEREISETIAPRDKVEEAQ